MIERICPKCKVPMNGEKCVKPDCGCTTEISSTIYWCNSCNIPVFEIIARYAEMRQFISQQTLDQFSPKKTF